MLRFCRRATGVRIQLRPSAAERWLRLPGTVTALSQLPHRWESIYVIPLTVEGEQENILGLEKSFLQTCFC